MPIGTRCNSASRAAGSDPLVLSTPFRDDRTGPGTERNRPRPGLGIDEQHPVAVDLGPAQPDDLVPAAAGEQQEADNVDLGRAAPIGVPVAKPAHLKRKPDHPLAAMLATEGTAWAVSDLLGGNKVHFPHARRA